MVNIFRLASSLYLTRDITPLRCQRRYTRGALQRSCCLVLMLLISLLVSLRVQAAVEAHVDRNPVAVDESFTLTVESDTDTDNEPDFSVLENDFDVLGQSSSTSIQIINGRSTRSQKWIVTLMPKKIGKVRIPGFTLNGHSSQALTISVVGAKQPQSANQGAEIFLQVDAEPKQAYVQQQIIYTLRLYRNVDLASGSQLSEPQLTDGDAIVKRLGQDSEFQTTVNGVPYVVIERKYAIFPQKSGHLTIQPVVFNGQVIDQQRGQRFMFSPFNPSVRPKRVRSEAVKLDVRAIPTGISAATWLPAAKLDLQEQWSQTPPKFSVGEPVTRTVAIMADGLTATQLPDLSIALPAGIKSYPDQPAFKDTVDANGITGVRQQKIALIPTRPGTMELPEIKLPWWNTADNKMEIATLPARRIDVGGSAPTPAQTVPPPPMATDQTAGMPAPATGPTQSVDKGIPVVNGGWWPIVALVFACAWIMTLLAWWFQRHSNGRRQSATVAVNTDRQLAQYERDVKTACHANDALAARTALLGWARLRWPDAAPTSLTAMAKRCSPALAQVLATLDRSLYAQGGDTWHGERLWQVFETDKPDDVATAGRSRVAGLEPLNRY